MSAIRAIFCCAGSSKSVAQGTRNLDLDDDGPPSPFPASQPPHETAAAPAADNGKSHAEPQGDKFGYPGGNLGHHVAISGGGPTSPNAPSGSHGEKNLYIDTPPPPSLERMRTPPALSPISTDQPTSPGPDSRKNSIASALLETPLSPLPNRSLELTHERMISSDWADTVFSTVNGGNKASPPPAVKEEPEADSAKTVTPTVPIKEEVLNSSRNYSRESVVIVDEKLSEFAWATTGHMSVITDDEDQPAAKPVAEAEPTPARSASPLPPMIEAEFNPTRDPRRNSTLSTYSNIIAPAAAAAAIARHSPNYTPISRPESPARFSQMSGASFVLNPSFSRTHSTKSNRSKRFSVQSKASTYQQGRFSTQSSATQNFRDYQRPFSSLSITESAYSTDSIEESSVSSSRTATPEPQMMRPMICPAEHPLLIEHLEPLQTILLPALDGLLANTSILSKYSLWERAMSLRREVRAFMSSGADECLIVVEGEVVGLKEAKLKAAVKSFVERGDAVRKAAGELTGEAKADGLERVRSFWVDRA